MPTNKVALKLQNSLIALSNIGSKRPSMTSIVGQITCQVPYLQRQVSMASLLVVRKITYIAIYIVTRPNSYLMIQRTCKRLFSSLIQILVSNKQEYYSGPVKNIVFLWVKYLLCTICKQNQSIFKDKICTQKLSFMPY